MPQLNSAAQPAPHPKAPAPASPVSPLDLARLREVARQANLIAEDAGHEALYDPADVLSILLAVAHVRRAEITRQARRMERLAGQIAPAPTAADMAAVRRQL